MNLGEAFSIRFNKLLKKNKISLYKFAKESCIARSTLTNILRGETKSPTLALIYQVADGFNMTILEFLNDPIFDKDNLEYL